MAHHRRAHSTLTATSLCAAFAIAALVSLAAASPRAFRFPSDHRVRRLIRSKSSDPTCARSGCPGGQLCCGSGSGDGCVDVAANAQHCGGCNNSCAYNRECCGGICVHGHGSDASNCGSCGRVCGVGVPCLYGMCGYSSGSGSGRRVVP